MKKKIPRRRDVYYYSLGHRFAGLLGSSPRSCVARHCIYHDSGNDARRSDPSPLVCDLAIPWCGVSAWCWSAVSSLHHQAISSPHWNLHCTGTGSHRFGRLSAVFHSLQPQGWAAASQPPQGRLTLQASKKNGTALYGKRNAAIFSPTQSHWKDKAVDTQRHT